MKKLSLLALIFLSVIYSSFSATLTVCPSGCGYTTIASALASANSGDTVYVNISGTHTEYGITINKSITIKGKDDGSTIVQAAATRSTAPDRHFYSNSTGITVNLENLTLQHGYAAYKSGFQGFSFGGSIQLDQITNCTFNLKKIIFKNNNLRPPGNSTDLNNSGGAISVGATTASGLSVLNLTNCTFDNNKTVTTQANANATGGALYIPSIITNIDSCIFKNNTAGSTGGAIYSGSNTSVVTIKNSYFEGNSVDETVTAGTVGSARGKGGAIYLTTTTNLVRCINTTFKNNTCSDAGGAISASGFFENCSFYGNSAYRGGAILSRYSSKLINCTFQGNSASNEGKAVYVGDYSTTSTAQLTIINTIIKGNTGTGSELYISNNYSNITTNSNNYYASVGSNTGTVPTSPISSVSGLSSTLADNGGFVPTFSLSVGSNLINAGTTSKGSNYDIPVKDGRHYSRTDAGIDVGAYEYNGVVDDAIAPSISYTGIANTASTSNQSVTATITDNNGVYWFNRLSDSLPRIYYKKNSGTWFSNAGSLQSGTGQNGTWSFTINNSNMGGVTSGDVISYYIAAQDVSQAGVIGSSPSGASGSKINSITSHPSSPNTYTIQSPNATVSSINRVGLSPTNSLSLDFLITFNQSVSGISTSNFDLTTTGSITGATISSMTGSGTTRTITVTYTGGDGTIRVNLANSTAITPSVSTSMPYTSGQAYTIDQTAPSTTSVSLSSNGTYKTSSTIDLAVNFDEAVAVTGTPRIAVNVGGSTLYANYFSGTGTSALVFRYTVQTNNLDNDGIGIGSSIELNSGTLKDLAGNNSNLSLNNVASSSGVLVDAVAPTVTSITTSAATTIGLSTNIDFSVVFSENVNITNTPKLVFNIASTSKNADYLSGTGTNTIIYRYTTTSGDNGAVSVTSLSVTSSSIKDNATNDATLTLNGVSVNVTVDGTAPSVSYVTFPSNQTYSSDQNLDFVVTYNEAVNVTGSPRLTLTINGPLTKYATYLSGTGTSQITFRYVIESGLDDNDGIVVANTIDLNSGTIKDLYNNNASLNLGTLPSSAGILIDASTPIISIGTAASITNNSFVVSSNNVTSSSSAVSEKGIVYGTSTNPTISGSKVASNLTGTGSYDISLSSLSPETLYYIRAYANNTAGTGYSSQSTIYTYADEPSSHSTLSASSGNTNINLTFQAATAINADGYILLRTSGSTAPTASGISDGVATIQGNLPNGTTLISIITDNSQTSYNNTGLSPANSTFSYALIPYTWDNSHAATYNYLTSGTIPTATATIGNPTVSTGSSSSITTSSVTISSNNVTSEGGANVTDRGIVWNTSTNPTTSNNKVAANPNPASGTGAYDVSISSLNAGTKYYVRAYATSSIATSYGSEITFFTFSSDVNSHSTFTSQSGESNINLTFQAATAIGADGYIILRTSGSTSPTASGISDGVATIQGNLPNGTTLVSIVTDNSQTSYNNTGLSPANSTFSYTLIPFNWDEANAETYNYLTSGTIPTLSATIGNPSVSTGSASNFASTSVSINSNNVTSEGGANVTDRGIVWNTSTNPTISNNKVATSPNPSSGTGTYNVNVSSLTAGTKYYAKAYATSSIATSYGNEITFYTYSSEPTAHPSISSTSGNTNINLTFDAPTSVNADGYIILRTIGLTAPTAGGISDGVTSIQGNLPSGTTLVSTITNSNQTSYDDTGLSPANSTFSYTFIPFNWDETNHETYNYLTSGTLASLSAAIGDPSVSTGTASNFASTSISIVGNDLTSEGGASVTDRGIVWNTSTNPTISNNKVATNPNPSSGTGTYDVNISSLNNGTKYYAKAYATSSITTSYGSEISFFTYSTEPSGYSTLSANAGETNINLSFQAASTFGADGYLLLRTIGSTAPTASGIADGSSTIQGNLPNGTTLVANITSSSQTTYDNTSLSPANTTFSYILIPYNWDETNAETYNYRTSGTIPSVSATIGIPVVTTGTKTNYGSSSITITGSNVTSEGGSNVTDRGVVWSTSANPTIANNKVATNPNPSSGTGTYDVNITGLSQNTKYYVRAYATSSIATSYGSEITFYTTPATQASSITWTSTTQTSITATWTSGSGSNRLMLIKKTTPISSTPLTNETEYTASSTYASGSSLDGGYVVYFGNGNTASVTGLTRNTLYYFRLFESFGSGTDIVYNQNTATNNPLNRNTNRKTGAEGGDVFDFDIQTISPNPANDYIKIDFTLPEDIALDMQVYDLQGNKMFGLDPNTKFASGHNQQTIDCSKFPAGTYFISMTNGSEAFYYSFVVER